MAVKKPSSSGVKIFQRGLTNMNVMVGRREAFFQKKKDSPAPSPIIKRHAGATAPEVDWELDEDTAQAWADEIRATRAAGKTRKLP